MLTMHNSIPGRVHSERRESSDPTRGRFTALLLHSFVSALNQLERVKGIEPSSQAWEAHILPLNHTRVSEFDTSSRILHSLQLGFVWLPPVMGRVGYLPFFVWLHRYSKLNRLRVGFDEWIGFFFDVPIAPPPQMLHHTNLYRLRLVIAQGDLEGFVNP
jgi:hypothetical protein